MTTVLADAAKMIAKGAPRVIHNDKELEAYTNALFQLTALENPSASEVQAIELLTLLVERYEEAHYPIPAADAVSMFLAGQRKLTLEQVRKLSSRFKLPADVFVRSP